MPRRQRRCLPLHGITPKSVLEHLLFAVIAQPDLYGAFVRQAESRRFVLA